MVSLLGVLGQHALYLGIHVIWVIQKASSFEWDPEEKRMLQQVWAVVPAFLWLGLYGLILEISVVRKEGGWSL